MKLKLKRANAKAIMALFLGGASISLITTGCFEQEIVPEEEYDVIDNESYGFESLTKEIVVPGEDFKLEMIFQSDPNSKRSWRITSDKFLYIEAKTIGLPSSTEVYIDNIHIDTSVKSKYAVVDGIMQDTMDDHVHSSQMIGFKISDNEKYYGVDTIEGANNEFIQGTFYGYNGYSSGEIEQKRYTEQDYRDLGVYANKITVVVDLLIKNSNDTDYRNVSVNTDFLVKVSTDEIKYDTEEKEGKVK